MQSYTGNRQPLVSVLRHSADAGKVDGVLDLLEGHGFRLCILDENAGFEKIIRKSCATVAVLSEAFNSCEKLADALVLAGSTGRELIPANLDGSKTDESLSRTFRARSIVYRGNYPTDRAFAERLLTADALKAPFVTPEQKRMGKLLTFGAAAVAAAVALAAVLGLRAAGPEPEPTPEPVSGHSEYEDYRHVVLAGDALLEGATVWDVAQEEWNGDRSTWRLLEDGSEVAPSRNTDLSFLQYMTNLETLVLLKQTGTELPDLSGLTKLTKVEIWDCEFTDITAFAACPKLSFMHVTARISDASQFAAFPRLSTLHLTECYSCLASLEGLDCPGLLDLQLYSDALQSLKGLEGCPKLISADLDVNRCRDCDALGTLTSLTTLRLRSDAVRDLSCLAACKNLSRIHLDNLWNLNGDLICLAGLDRLDSFALYCPLNDLDFLKGRSPDTSIDLGFCDGNLSDFEGLSAVRNYRSLNINRSGHSLEPVLPYLEGAKVQELELGWCSDIRLDALPAVESTLTITDGDLETLEGLPGNLFTLRLQNLPRLQSLKGLEGSSLKSIKVEGCPRLTDWEPLYSVEIGSLELRGTFTLPDLGKIRWGAIPSLDLMGYPDLPDLSLLEALPEGMHFKELHLADMDRVQLLKPLERLSGTILTVPPRLLEQAQELRDKGIFQTADVDYSTLDWGDGLDITLLSWEELDELPESVLKHVTSLCLVGDTVVDQDGGADWDCDFSGRNPVGVVRYPDGTETRTGEGMADLSYLAKLPGLRWLTLCCQPLTSLEGIQELSELENLRVEQCPALKDISAAFALPSLSWLNLCSVPFESLEGIQNLRRLEELELRWCSEDPAAYAPLADIAGNLRTLRIDGDRLDFADLAPYLENGCLENLRLFHCVRSQEELEMIPQVCPGIRRLELLGCENITDLSPLFVLQDLESVMVSPNAPIRLPEGQELPFTLEIGDW